MKVFHQLHVELETDSGGNLVARAQRGEEAAFAAFFDAYKHRVYGICLRMTASHQEAEDFAEAAFMRAFRKIFTFRGESAFFTFLQQVAANTVRIHLHRKRVKKAPFAQIRSLELRSQ